MLEASEFCVVISRWKERGSRGNTFSCSVLRAWCTDEQAREHKITLLSPHSAQQEERRGQRERDVERRGKSSPDTLCCADGVFKRLQAECTAVKRKPAKFGPFAPWHGSLLSSKVILPLGRRDVHLVALVLTATHRETVDNPPTLLLLSPPTKKVSVAVWPT